MNAMEISVEEYQKMVQTINTLQNNEMLQKINTLVEVLYENKYGLFMKDYYDDLTEYSIQTGWNDEPSPWNNVLKN